MKASTERSGDPQSARVLRQRRRREWLGRTGETPLDDETPVESTTAAASPDWSDTTAERRPTAATIFRVDPAPSEYLADEPLETFPARERKRTLTAAARLASDEIDTRRRRVSLTGLLDRLRRRFRPYALSRRIALSVVGPEIPATCAVSEEAIDSLLAALVWNALECVPEGAVVRVEARLDEAARAATIEIRDNGPLLAPAEWERLRERFAEMERTSDLFALDRPEFALALRLAEREGLAVECESRPATNRVRIALPTRLDGRSVRRAVELAATRRRDRLSVFALSSREASSAELEVIDAIAYGSLPPGSILWRSHVDRWLAVAPLEPTAWFDWYRGFAAGLHLERIRAGRRLAAPGWKYCGAWAASDCERLAQAVEAFVRGDFATISPPPLAIPSREGCRIDAAEETLRLLGYGRVRREANEWGESRLVAERCERAESVTEA